MLALALALWDSPPSHASPGKKWVSHSLGGQPCCVRGDVRDDSLLRCVSACCFADDVSLQVEFVRGGEIQFVGTTWAGYVGLLTVMRPGCYSLSVNYRRNAKPSGLRNLWNAMTKCWPVGWDLLSPFPLSLSLARICVPLGLVHGSADPVFPPNM